MVFCIFLGDFDEAHRLSRWALIYNALAATFGVITILIVTAMTIMIYCDTCFAAT